MSPLGAPPFCIIQAGKQKSVDLARAVMDSAGGGVVHVGPIAPDRVPDSHTPVVIGVHPTTVETLHALRREQRPFVTVDNGYFRPYKEGGYFRATSNALQWIASRPGSGVGRDFDCEAEGAERFRALDLEVKPWREVDNGGYILIPLQSSVWLEMMRERPTWQRSVVDRLRAYSDRKIVIRQKPVKGYPIQPTLEEHLAGAWAVLGYSSNVLLKAAMQGIPICSTAYCATSPMGCATPDSLMLGPTYRERESILHALAANQWTIEEIAAGKMWRDLQDRYEPEFLTLA
jgi:hypothetical protein